MSHRVTVSLDGVAAECQGICDRASDSLHQIDDVIADISKNATRFKTADTEGYIAMLKESKAAILRELTEFERYLDEVKHQTGTFRDQQEIMDRARELNRTVLDLTGPKLDILPEMINEQLFSNMEKYQEELKNAVREKRFSLAGGDMERLSGIQDIGLRECVYREIMTGRHASFDAALAEARKAYREKTDRLLEKNRDRILGRMKADLEKHHLDTAAVDSIMAGKAPLDEKTVSDISRDVDKSIRGEMMRKKAIGMIVGAIRKRGFLFDPKQCIKLDRASNIVRIAVKRPDGRQVTFEVYLDGRFMYHFEGYEGMACTKDENPFLETLEKVYGMKIASRHIDWENPDRLQNRKMQAMGHKTGHGSR